MNLFKKIKLSKEIKKRKAERPYMRIEKIDGYHYYLRAMKVNTRDIKSKTYTLLIEFFHMDPMPNIGDGFYLSESMIEGMNENLYSFAFSTHIGEVCARPPHDF